MIYEYFIQLLILARTEVENCRGRFEDERNRASGKNKFSKHCYRHKHMLFLKVRNVECIIGNFAF